VVVEELLDVKIRGTSALWFCGNVGHNKQTSKVMRKVNVADDKDETTNSVTD
jgi:hypothetical protein